MVVTLNDRATLTLPADLRRRLGLEPGDTLELTVEGHRLVLTPVAIVPRRLRLTAKGAAKEAEADAEIKAGKTRRFNTASEFLKDLRSRHGT